MGARFIDREKELEFLNREYGGERSSFVVIYGRRRIGKTALIKRFIEGKPALYFLATEEMERENLNALRDLVSDFTGNQLLKRVSDPRWGDLFNAFKDHMANAKKILVLDEFQYLVRTNSAFPSILQRIWDEHLKTDNVMVILCGSLTHMMESQTLDYGSPLYGRRTGQIKLKQIEFSRYGEFFDGKSSDELVQLYAVTGGVPKYIEVFAPVDDIFRGIEHLILDKNSFLYEEPYFLLEKELSEVGSYFSIIKTIAAGNHKLGKISAALGVPPTRLTKYLGTLMSLDLVERQVPITENNPEKSKKGLYFINDNFIEFWFRFIFPFRSHIEMDDTGYVMNRIRKSFVENHVSLVYEKICRARMWDLNRDDRLGFKLERLGRWWSNLEEIDIVGFDRGENIIFGECKYTAHPVGVDVFHDLVRKAGQVEWNRGCRKERYILFGRSGFTRDMIDLADERKDIILVSGR
jgi:hypothetical protein